MSVLLLLLQPAAQPTGTALTASNSENLVSGMVSNGDYRIYNVEKCDYNVTLFSVYPVFAAHQIEWNTMGKTMAWWSVLIGLPKTADISETEKVRFYASGAKHVAKVAKGLHLTGKRVLDFGARTTDVLPPLRPRSGPLVDTRNQQTPVSELLCRL
ncbi:hypothetical protein EMIHUDRAFT_462911 [Emiliania huxleyi CCMP1516]|uniref:Uncharacterized protein n=2 Tax=Emiliania huxleyi TaxID=2903 RepID=A0A0D3K2P9_EMIH1|nr:hypothetical protein EMIHUDRAFT_462911 [Emiliania huxleyi CCMP1516]EOD30034.1 hypothetical protein EMIHUDRAFT_462911 [Emiliania huxleyi CCMP1516]|eukprot:XP_005782463.1 hypothetical protein EMIHUDRAFT_462911 [Emiliania huxleyi CCMP1516]